MNREQIIPSRTDVLSMAREAGFEQNSLGMTYTSGSLPKLLERFAALIASRVAAKASAASASVEREACAKICDDIWQEDGTAFDCRESIRARGETTSRGNS